jgi:hypothetical protein
LIIKKTTSYQEAMERSWPQGGFLVELMNGVNPKSEDTALKALRLGKEKLDTQIERLGKSRENIYAEIVRICSHPAEALCVEEMQLDSVHRFEVWCTTCDKILRTHVRNDA